MRGFFVSRVGHVKNEGNHSMSDSTEKIEQTPEAQKEPLKAESNEEKTIPYDRFQAVNESKKAIEAELAQIKAAEEKRLADSEAAKKKQLEEQNKFQELYKTAESERAATVESLTASTERIESLEKALLGQWEAQKGIIPAEFLGFIEEKPVEDRIQWLSENSEKLTEKDKSNGTPRGVQSRRITPPDQNQSKRAPVLPSFRF